MISVAIILIGIALILNGWAILNLAKATKILLEVTEED